VRIFEGLVFTLGHRGDHDLAVLSQVEERGTHQVADVLDHDHRVGCRVEAAQSSRQHFGVQVAARAGVDLHHVATGGADALGVVRGLLITLDHAEAELAPQVAKQALQQAGLAGSRRADEVQRQNAAPGKPAAIALRQLVVLGEQVLLERDDVPWTAASWSQVEVGV
jgi:hypothetical protein